MYALSAQEARAVRLFGVSPKEGGAVGGFGGSREKTRAAQGFEVTTQGARRGRPTLSSEILRGWISLLVSALGLLYTT